jgi:hypothetical protein
MSQGRCMLILRLSPLHIRAAATSLMKWLGYGDGYRYDPHEPEGLAAGQEYLPDALRGARWYEPIDRGFEKTVAERLKWWEERKEAGRRVGGQADRRAGGQAGCGLAKGAARPAPLKRRCEAARCQFH